MTELANLPTRINAYMNSPMIHDLELSYLAVSILRVLCVALMGLMLLRGAQMLHTARACQPRFTLHNLLEYGGVTRWRTPIISVAAGTAVIATCLTVQIMAGQASPTSPLGNLTPYLAIIYSGLIALSLGLATGFGLVREIIGVWSSRVIA